MNIMPNHSCITVSYKRPPFFIILLSAGIITFWAVQLLSPLPAALSGEPASDAVDVSRPLNPSGLWHTAAAQKSSSIKILAILGSPSGAGRVVLEIDGKSVAASSGGSPLPGYRIIAVRPAAVDIEIDGKIQTLAQPLPVAGSEISISR